MVHGEKGLASREMVMMVGWRDELFPSYALNRAFLARSQGLCIVFKDESNFCHSKQAKTGPASDREMVHGYLGYGTAWTNHLLTYLTLLVSIEHISFTVASLLANTVLV
jgi:hypothetical protein